jgi:hypothetical protein
VVGEEPWGVAVVLGSFPFLLGLALALWSIPRFEGRKRIYFATRGSLYLVLGVGLNVGHWRTSVGIAPVVFFIIGQVVLAVTRRRILGTGWAGA